MKKTILSLSLVLALALALTACGSKAIMSSEANSETGGVDVVMENAGDATGVNGYVTIEEGQCLIISPYLEKGSVEVRAYLMEREATADDLGAAEEATLEETVDGKVMAPYDLEPGEYMLTFTAKDKPTGTLSALPYDAEEYQTQNETLQEELEKLNLDLAEQLGQ